MRWQGVDFPGKHEPIVTRELFELVQEVLMLKGFRGRQRRNDHPMRGLLHCGECGSRLCFTVAKRRFEYFFCLGHRARHGLMQPALLRRERRRTTHRNDRTPRGPPARRPHRHRSRARPRTRHPSRLNRRVVAERRARTRSSRDASVPVARRIPRRHRQSCGLQDEAVRDSGGDACCGTTTSCERNAAARSTRTHRRCTRGPHASQSTQVPGGPTSHLQDDPHRRRRNHGS